MSYPSTYSKDCEVTLLSDIPEEFSLFLLSSENKRSEYKEIQADIELDAFLIFRQVIFDPDLTHLRVPPPFGDNFNRTYEREL